MEFQLDNGNYQIVFSASDLNIAIEESAPLNVIVGDTTEIDVGQVITYIKSGEKEINEAVQQGIASFDSNAQEKTDIFNAIVPNIEEDIDNLYKNKQDNLSSINAGTGISIVGSGANVLISNTQTSAEWGKITGDITNQEDLQQALNNAGTPDDLSIKKENNILKAVGLLDQNDTSKAISVWSGSREQYNEIEHKNENTLYHTTDDVGESVDVTREIELNNPFSLLDYKWSEYEISNASWLISNGAFHSGATYVAVYELLLKIYNVTETKDGVNVKLSTEAYEDTDFVLNTDETTFRLPIKVKLASGNAVVGNGMALGITTGTYTGSALNHTNTNNIQYPFNIADGQVLSIGEIANNSVAWRENNQAFGVATTPEMSGIETSDEGLYLYFYVGETIQDANVINASNVLTRVANSIDRTIKTDRETVVGWGMPDYSAGTNLTSFTADRSYIGYLRNEESTVTVTIDGEEVAKFVPSSGYVPQTSTEFLIPKNSVVVVTGSANKLIKYPLKGEN